MTALKCSAACLICLLALSGSASAASVRSIKLAANDLVYDPFNGKIYASVPGSSGGAPPPSGGPGNSITVIDPVTGAVGPSVPAGPEPDRLALSDDGRYLYIGFDAAPIVQRLDLRTGTLEAPVSLGSDPNRGPYYVEDLQVQPGHPETIAIARRNHIGSPEQEGIAIFDNGVQRPMTTPAGATGEYIDEVRFASPSTLYGYGDVSPDEFYTLSVDASGVSIRAVTKGVLPHTTGGIQLEDGWIFTNNGDAIDPGPPAQVIGHYWGVPFGSLVAPDIAAGRVDFLVQQENATQLLAFDRRTFAQVGSEPLPGYFPFPGHLIRWKEGGLAFRTLGGQVVLVETSLAPTEPLTLRLDPASVIGGHPVTGSLVLRGGRRPRERW